MREKVRGGTVHRGRQVEVYISKSIVALAQCVKIFVESENVLIDSIYAGEVKAPVSRLQSAPKPSNPASP